MAKFVRKLNRDESGYSYEEVKSNVTPKKKPKGFSANIKDLISGIKSSSFNPVIKDAIVDAKAIRDEALKNAKDRMENSIITGVTGARTPWYVPPGLNGGVTYNPIDDTYTVNGHRLTAEAFADLHNSGDISQVASPANMEPIQNIGSSAAKLNNETEYLMSGSISMSELDDSSFYPTASCTGPNEWTAEDSNAFYNIDTQPVIDMITTKKYREDNGTRLRRLAGLPLATKSCKPNIHGRIIIE